MSLLITFEGLDGSGKSTQIQLLAHTLRQRGLRVHCAREPGGTPIGEQIRQILHQLNNTEMHPLTEILLYSASRAQLIAQVVQPILAQGGIVLCDRYADSTYVYQGYGHRLPLTTLQTITQFATQNLTPDLTFLLDLSVEIGLTRKEQASQAGQGEWNRMDQLAFDFHQRVRQGYLTLAKAEPHRWHLIKANQDIQVIHQEICLAVDRLLEKILVE